jgi:hypothetical protein
MADLSGMQRRRNAVIRFLNTAVQGEKWQWRELRLTRAIGRIYAAKLQSQIADPVVALITVEGNRSSFFKLGAHMILDYGNIEMTPSSKAVTKLVLI